MFSQISLLDMNSILPSKSPLLQFEIEFCDIRIFWHHRGLGRRQMFVWFFVEIPILVDLGDNCIQNFHLGRYIVGYTVGNLVLRRRASGAVKRDFRTYIWRYTSPNENFEYRYPQSNALLQLERCKPHKASRHPTNGDIINGINYFRQYIARYTVPNF